MGQSWWIFPNIQKETSRILKHCWQSVIWRCDWQPCCQQNHNYYIALSHVRFTAIISQWTRGVFSVRYRPITQHAIISYVKKWAQYCVFLLQLWTTRPRFMKICINILLLRATLPLHCIIPPINTNNMADARNSDVQATTSSPLVYDYKTTHGNRSSKNINLCLFRFYRQ